MAVAELLDVEAVGEDRKLEEDGAVAVDPGGIDVVEAALARQVQLGMKFAAGNLQLALTGGGKGQGHKQQKTS